MTSKYRKLFWVFAILSFLLNVGPIATYTIIALAQSTLVANKVTMCCTVLIVAILSVVSWINKTTMRSRIWVILLGLYVCLDYILTPLLIIAITQIADEWIIAPAAKSYKSKLTIHKEMDKRI